MSSKSLPSTAEVFGQSLPPVAETFSPQEQADLDARTEANDIKEAARAMQVERFMQAPISQKFRLLFVSQREIRDVVVYTHAQYGALSRDISELLGAMSNELALANQRIQALENLLQPTMQAQQKAEPTVERQLSLLRNDEGQEVPIV